MKHVETDIAIAGGGPAGLAAAVAAAERGARVAVFEKSSTTGGAGNMGMGPLGVETRLQKERLIGITKEEAFKKFMDYTHWRVDARLVKAYIDKSADTIAWLEEMGVEFFDAARYFVGSEATWHIVKPSSGRPGPRAAAVMFRIMTERAQELGVEIFLETPVKKILKEGDRVTGFLAEDKAGEAVRVEAKAVIIATGGFGDNPEWIKKHLGYEWGKDLFSFRIPGVTGDGLRMAWEAGAGKSEINMELIYALPFNLEYFSLDAVMRQPNLLVNLNGERFLNEEYMDNTTFTGNAIARQPGRCAVAIFDEATKRHYQKHGLDLVSLVHGPEAIDHFDAEVERALAQGYPYMIVADSVEELAEKAGIDPAALKKTVEEYNEACAIHYDSLFHKNHRYLRPVKEPKFYAAKFYPSAYGSLGGIRINYKTEVLTDEGLVIPGLYAAGTDACSIYGDSYVFILPGNTMGFALNSGRIAGENAAEYVQGGD
ncbi:MAG: FAD-dependent oxidoreductase [Desulfotomaculales bacterium]